MLRRAIDRPPVIDNMATSRNYAGRVIPAHPRVRDAHPTIAGYGGSCHGRRREISGIEGRCVFLIQKRRKEELARMTFGE